MTPIHKRRHLLPGQIGVLKQYQYEQLISQFPYGKLGVVALTVLAPQEAEMGGLLEPELEASPGTSARLRLLESCEVP